MYQSFSLDGYRLNILSIRIFRFPVLRIYPLSWILTSNCFINALHSRQIDQDSQRENSQSTAIPRSTTCKNLDSIFLIIIHCIRRFKWAIINESISYLVSLTVTRLLFDLKLRIETMLSFTCSFLRYFNDWYFLCVIFVRNFSFYCFSTPHSSLANIN